MPKIIKKTKPVKKEEKKLEEVVARAKSFKEWKKEYKAIAVSVPIVLVIIAAVYFYLSTTQKNLQEHEYEGYRLYHLIKDAQMPSPARVEQALESFKKAYKIKPTPVNLFYIAVCNEDLARYEDAQRALDEFSKRFPNNERFMPLVYYKRAMIALKTGKTEDALKDLEALSNYKNGSLKDLSLIESARILKSLGRVDEAKKKYEAISKDSPFYKEAENALRPNG